jgi:hypothetical protein
MSDGESDSRTLEGHVVTKEWLTRIRWQNGESILEVGCGHIDNGLHTGSDISPNMNATRVVCGPDTIRVMCGPATTRVGTMFGPKTFDHIIMTGAVNYFPSMEYLFNVLTQLCMIARKTVYVGDVRMVQSADSKHLLMPTSTWDPVVDARTFNTSNGAQYDVLIDVPLQKNTAYQQLQQESAVWITPLKSIGADMCTWGQKRLQLAVIVRDILDTTGVTYFLDGGTLLGALRCGRFIPHDDDFDFGVYLPTYHALYGRWLQIQLQRLLPAPYRCRFVHSYAEKLEIYDPTQGSFTLPGDVYEGADFHFVTVDIQFYTKHRTENYIQCMHRLNFHACIPSDAITPVATIQLEGEPFKIPAKSTVYLTALYGYLGQDHEYDPSTRLYIQRSNPMV